MAVAAAAAAAAACCPRRCFLVDIASVLSSNYNNSNSKNKDTPPGIALLRLMGTVVSIVQQNLNEAPTIFIDDGTGLAAIVTPLTMLEAINCCIGTSLDCIVRVDYSGHSINNISSNDCKLHADSLMIVPDAHAETLRWLELSYLKKNPGNLHQQQDQDQPSRQSQQQSQSQSQLLYMQSRTGYPCPSVQADDVYQLIQSDGSDEYVYQGQKGLLAKDLAIVLDISIEHVHDLIQELQIEGLVYQNQAGAFLPL